MKIKNNILLFILSILFGIKSFAQVYPVQINTQLIPPYSLKLSDYVTPGTNRIGVNVLLTDITKPEYYVRLELVIEGDGITIKTSPTYKPGPIILQGGVPEYFTSSDLTEYFNPNNLDFSGYSKSSYLSTGRLPEGVYRFSFRAYDYNKGVRVSNSTAITAWLLLNDPPIINLPVPDYKVENIDPQNVVFQWTPRHTGSPNSAFTTEYEFTLVEIWPEGRDPNNAMQTSVPIYQATTTNTALVYGLSEPFLEPGREYAYRIQAHDIDGRDMFKNNGYSEVRKFIFGDACKMVTQVEAKSDKSFEAEITWQPQFNHTAFSVRYRKANSDDAEWFEEDTYLDYIKINDLQENTEYEYQVMAYCGTYEGEYTDVKTFKTSKLEVASFECGATDDENSITNHDPLPVLNKGDYIWSGNFMFKITEANGSNGTFSGKAYAMVPYLNYVKLVAEFTNIKVNTDNQVYEGEITSVYNPDSPFVIGIGGDDDDGTGDGNDTTDGEDTTGGDDVVISDTTYTVDIDSVYIDGDDIIIVTEEGTDTLDAGEDIIITDQDGDTWTVEDGAVITGGGTTGGGSGTGGGNGGTVEDPVVDDDYEIKIKVDFKDYNNQSYGYDELKYDVHKPMFQQRQIYGKQEYIPWKSIVSAGTDQILVEFTDYDTIITPDHVKFRTGAGINLTATKFEGQDNIRLLNLTGKTDEEVDEIEAYITYKDTSETEKEFVIGGLNTISYDQQIINLVIVPVNGSAGFSASDFTNQLNAIYKQSVVKWNVTLDEVYNIDADEWDKDEDGKMNDGESTFLSNYSDEQNKFRRQYKSDRDIDKNAYYVFLLNSIPSKSGLAGYMPLKEQYAFIHSANSSNAARLIAHELGHGAFRLWHTFSSESNYFMSQGSSDNLMDYADNATRLHKYQWDYIHNPEGGFYMFQDEEEAAMIADDSEIEWLLELYSPNISEKFNEAHTNNDIQEMQRLIAWALEHKFSDDWLEQVRIGFTLEDDRAVAVLTHNTDAPVKGMRLYYTKKEYEGDQFVGVIASEDPIYFSPDKEYPVNVSLYQSQTGRVDLERTESLVLPKEYYDIKEGLIPKDWWMAGFVDPYAAGIVDGAWEVLVGVYDIAKFASAYNITNSFYWTPEAFEIRENTKEFGKFLIELWKSEETRDNFKQKVKEEFGEYIDDITCLESECQYLQGKLIFDVATLFIGVGEAKAIIKGEKLTIGVVQIVKNLPKNIGKLVKVAEKTGLKIQKVGDDLIRILSKQGDEIATITDKTLKPSKFIRQGEEIGEAVDGYKLIKNGDELGFKLALDKGDFIAGKTIVDIKHGTNGKVAVIGRKMDNHVIPVAEELKLQGKSVEIFNKNYFPDDFKFEIDGNKYTWQQIEDDFKFGNYTRDPATNYIPDSELPNTLMYKANEKWAKKIVDEGYDIIDIGYPDGETTQSVFYNMELNTIFN